MESAEAIEHFIKECDHSQYRCIKKQTIIESFKLAGELKHDVFNCIYIAFALQEGATAIITTDTDFERLCKCSNLGYMNPVPLDILKRFKEWNQ